MSKSIRVTLIGRPGHWKTYPEDASGPGRMVRRGSTPPQPNERVYTRAGDDLPNPQAFSIPQIQAYPTRTATCRQCDELVLHSCARGCCAKLPRSHAELVNAVASGQCPLNKFTEEL